MITYKTREENLSELIAIIKLFIEKNGYVPKNPRVLPYEGTTLPPYWLEADVIEEMTIILTSDPRIITPEFITKPRIGDLYGAQISEWIELSKQPQQAAPK